MLNFSTSVLKKMFLGFAVMVWLVLPIRSVMAAGLDNPYPTIVIADYVFGCMGSNGQTRQALERCSCSIDVIASIVSFNNYERAETVLRLRQLSGEKGVIYKTSARWKSAVSLLRSAQAEAEVRCF